MLRVVVTVGVLIAVSISLQALRLRGASIELESVTTRLRVVEADVLEIERLAEQQKRVELGQRPEGDLVALLGDVLRASRLPASRLRQVNQEADQALGSRYRRQVLRVILEPMKLSELGRFMKHWHTAGHIWSVSSIDLQHPASDRAGVYRITLRMSATYLFQGKE